VLLIEKRATEAVLVVFVAVALSAACGIDDMVSCDAWISYTPAVEIVHCPRCVVHASKRQHIYMHSINAI